MKTGVSSYSFGKYASKDNLGYLGVIEKAAEMGFEGIDFVDGYHMNDIQNADRMREKAAECNIEIVAFTLGADLMNPKNGLDDEIKRMQGYIDYAARAGAKYVRHDVAHGYDNSIKHSRGYDNALPTIANACRELTKYAEQKGIKTMTENHGFFSQDSARVEKLINTVAHDNFGFLLDIGNFMCADEDPTLAVSIMAPYAFHVHAKDFHYKSGMDVNPGNGWFRTRANNYLRGAIIGHGDAKVYQSIEILKNAGYDGYLTVEFEGMEDNILGIKEGLANLKRFIESRNIF
ncbi:MAG: sugar phosphate isomerase/epimerase [Ruminococcaceae bacterium]|nr:sugar phosphate isomerase/epimerase [Oscillospiraceae bacterium]